MNMKKIEYHSLYVLKALAALFVLMIHFEFYKRQYLEPIFKCGVPVFYIISGFFLYSANPISERGKIRKGMTKIFKIMLFFNLAYFILQYALTGTSCIRSLHDVVRLIMFGDNISGHLWFLTSYLWTLVVFGLLLMLKNGYRIMGVLALLYFVEEILVGQYSFLYLTLNRVHDYVPCLGVSLPMMYIGYSLKKHEQILKTKLVSRGAGLALMSSVVFLYLEHKLLSDANHYMGGIMISSYVATICFFVFCLVHQEYGKGTFIEKIGKYHSGNIYYWQFFPYYLFVSGLVTEYRLGNVCLLVMLIVLLGWSYGVNILEGKLLKIRNRIICK